MSVTPLESTKSAFPISQANCVRGHFLPWRPMFDEIRNQRGWLLFSFLPTSRICGKELLSKTIFILCITLDWRLQDSVYCHWISDVVCFATCNLNVSSHTRKGPRLGKCSCIFCFASLQNRVLINGCLRS